MQKLNIGDSNMLDITRLKDIREDHDISQEEMSKILGVNRSTYSLWELGVNVIPLKNLCDYADYFNYSLDYVLRLTNKQKESTLIKGLNLKALGNNLKAIRLKNELSQENIANMLNVSQACITKYEKGQICISTTNLYKFCKNFKVKLNKICEKEK